MSGRLSRIVNWAELAAQTEYSVEALAECTGRSVRQLERFFLLQKGQSPQTYLREIRMRRAAELLKEISQVKQVARLVCYKQVGNFSREFRRYFGMSPSRWRDSRPENDGEMSH